MKRTNDLATVDLLLYATLFVPAGYALLIVILDWIIPGKIVAWYQLTSDLTEPVAETLPIAKNYSIQLTQKGHVLLVPFVRHLLAMQWILLTPIFIAFLVYRARRFLCERGNPIPIDVAMSKIAKAFVIVGVGAFATLYGIGIDFGQGVSRYSLTVHNLDVWLVFYSGMVWIMLIAAVSLFFSAAEIATGRWRNDCAEQSGEKS